MPQVFRHTLRITRVETWTIDVDSPPPSNLTPAEDPPAPGDEPATALPRPEVCPVTDNPADAK